MCLLVCSLKGRPAGKHLAHAMENNSDGWGYCFPFKGKIYARHGLREKDFWPQWKADGPFTQESPLLWHARWATHGKFAKSNCHPFEVPGHDQLYFAHNGVITSMGATASGDKSDTQLFVETVLTPLDKGFHREWDKLHLISFVLGAGKGAFMDGTGHIEIINESFGHWKKNIWYSNSSYEKVRYTKSTFIPASQNVCSNSLWPVQGSGWVKDINGVWRKEYDTKNTNDCTAEKTGNTLGGSSGTSGTIYGKDGKPQSVYVSPSGMITLKDKDTGDEVFATGNAATKNNVADTKPLMLKDNTTPNYVPLHETTRSKVAARKSFRRMKDLSEQIDEDCQSAVLAISESAKVRHEFTKDGHPQPDPEEDTVIMTEDDIAAILLDDGQDDAELERLMDDGGPVITPAEARDGVVNYHVS